MKSPIRSFVFSLTCSLLLIPILSPAAHATGDRLVHREVKPLGLLNAKITCVGEDERGYTVLLEADRTSLYEYQRRDEVDCVLQKRALKNTLQGLREINASFETYETTRQRCSRRGDCFDSPQSYTLVRLEAAGLKFSGNAYIPQPSTPAPRPPREPRCRRVSPRLPPDCDGVFNSGGRR